MSNEYIDTFVIVGCGSAKNPGPMPAKEKYSSNYFALKRNYAEDVGDRWHILSAEYGLIPPDMMIDDYDTTVSDLSDDEYETWAFDARTSLVRKVAMMRPTEVHVLLGQAYLDALEVALEYFDEAGIEIVRPFDDTSGIGEQMSVLKSAIA